MSVVRETGSVSMRFAPPPGRHQRHNIQPTDVQIYIVCKLLPEGDERSDSQSRLMSVYHPLCPDSSYPVATPINFIVKKHEHIIHVVCR